MAEKLEDLNLPQAPVSRIIKEALSETSEDVQIGKDVKAALAKAASMFILYITSQATQSCHSTNRKTLTAKDIFSALEEAEFGEFIEPLQHLLTEFQNSSKKVKKVENGAEALEAESDGGEDVAEEDI